MPGGDQFITRREVNKVAGNYLPLAGGTMSGNIGMGAGGTVDGVDLSVHDADYGKHTKVVVKSADESVNNSGALQNDDELKLTIGANEVWNVKLLLRVVSVAGAGWAYDWTYPAGMTLIGVQLWAITGAVLCRYETSTFNHGSAGAMDTPCWIDFILVNGATPGTWQFRWAQNAATVGNTTVKKDSCLVCTRLV